MFKNILLVLLGVFCFVAGYNSHPFVIVITFPIWASMSAPALVDLIVEVL